MLVNPELIRAAAEAEIREAIHRMLEDMRDKAGLKITGITMSFRIGEFTNRVTDEPGFRVDLDMRLHADTR